MHSKREMKRTWILGAGFSRPLGGKLLLDLFDKSCSERVRSAFPGLSAEVSDDVRDTLTLYHDHLERPEKPDLMPLWRNAEEFLDRLDTAALQPSSGEYQLILNRLTNSLKRHHENKIEAANETAKALLAFECHAFLQHSSLGTERWHSYAIWAESLTRHDTIVTFNYDLVLERLGKTYKTMYSRLPAETFVEGKANVLKLHGSIDWQKTDKGVERVEPTDELSWNCFCQSLIGTPGPDKLELARVHFEPLWHDAMAAIRESDEVLIIGYRMPETDANATHRILGAIANRKSDQQRIKIVLGPAINAADAVRLKCLIEWATRQLGEMAMDNEKKRAIDTDAVEIVPLYCQDFLPLYARRVLKHVARGSDIEFP